MKKILGLDLGTNSIGWAVINSSVDDEGKEKLTSISSCGSRIIPMDAATLGDFDKGNAKSSVAERTRLRGIRRFWSVVYYAESACIGFYLLWDFCPNIMLLN